MMAEKEEEKYEVLEKIGMSRAYHGSAHGSHKQPRVQLTDTSPTLIQDKAPLASSAKCA